MSNATKFVDSMVYAVYAYKLIPDILIDLLQLVCTKC